MLRLNKEKKKTGRIYLTIQRGYRDENGKPRNKHIESIGYVDVLEKEYDDPIVYFENIIKKRNEEENQSKTIMIGINTETRIEDDSPGSKNYGHVIFSKIYHELEIDRFLDNKRRHANYKFNLEQIARLLIFSRILHPGSKLYTQKELQKKYFDNFQFTIDDIYSALDEFDRHSVEMQQYLHENIAKQYGRVTDLIYYDVTNYYFEIDLEDELRKRGPCKEKKHDPIVQMGLAVDDQSIPISYHIYPGNTHDSETYLPQMAALKKKFNAGRIVVVADKGLNCGDNIAFNLALGDGYIFSQSVRGANAELKKWILDESGYDTTGDFRKKSRTIPVSINVTVKQAGKKKTKKKVPIDQKQIVFFSQKYADRSRYKRNELLAKAADLVSDPSKYDRATHYGAAGYIKDIKFDKKTGKVIEPEESLSLDMEKVRDEEKYDGYYLIVTSEFDMHDDKVIEAYHGLWQIEESFKITKSTLDARPIFLRNMEHINAHFLICFIALLILRLVEHRIKCKYRAARIVESLRQVTCSHVEENLYMFNYCDEVVKHLETVFGVDMTKKYQTLGEIRSNLASAKKHKVSTNLHSL
jgi:transposase